MRIAIFLVKRFVAMVITVASVIAIGYIMMFYSPGGFFSASGVENALSSVASENPQLYQQIINEFNARYGLNLPLWRQILLYVWHSLTFNFGYSMQNPSVKIISTLKSSFPVSAELAFGSVLLALVIGIPLGVVAALKQNTWIDYVISGASLYGQAVPAFVTAVLLVLLFGVVWQNILPINGWGHFNNAILPVIALGIGAIGTVTKYMRVSLIEAMRQDYIRTAYAKGVAFRRIVLRHGVRNALTALITVAGPMFAFTVVNTIFVENVFGIPGLGSQLNTAFTNDDFPLAITSIFILGSMVLISNLIVDILYSVLDPRVRLE
ncbi:ABC transporter permease [Alicyclobacillus acidiphilus]|nr:ABC transporter permease [Alicyclobacillus acidiphilus]